MKKYCFMLLSGLFITTLLFGCNANISVRNSTYSSHIPPSHLLKKDIFSYPYLNMKKKRKHTEFAISILRKRTPKPHYRWTSNL